MSAPPPRPSITIVGLGPGDPGLRTLAAQRALDGAARVILRTRVHPGLDDLANDPRVVDCDDLYHRNDDFAAVYHAVAERVIEATTTTDAPLVFAVPGHPRFGERSVPLIEERAASIGVAVEVLGAVSAIDAVANALRIDPFADGLQIVDALDLASALEREPFAGGTLGIDPVRPLLIGQLYAAPVAVAVKLALGRFYGDDHETTLIRAAGVPGEERIARFPLHALDRQAVDHLTSLWLPAVPPLDAVGSPFGLQRIVAQLRAPGGCPWDRAQSHQSLRGAVIEEAYETLDAIDADDQENLAEELGDLVLQAFLHAQIAEEAGHFAIEDVYAGVARKLIRRHPHVFGDRHAATPDDVVATWESVKASERQNSGRPEKTEANRLDRLPRSMPALQRTVELLGPRLGAGLRTGSLEDDREIAFGDALLDAAEAAIAAALDPEKALDAALRRRVTTAANGHDAGALPSNR